MLRDLLDHAASFGAPLSTDIAAGVAVVAAWAAVVARRDVRRREATERAFDESETRYRVLVDHSPDAIIVHVDRRFVYVNAAAVALYGARSAAELLGRDVMDLVHPDDRDVVLDRVRAVTDHRVPSPRAAMRLLTVDGAPVEVETLAAPMRFEGADAVQAVMRDMGDRNRAERALRESEAVVRAAMNASLDAVYILRSVRDDAGRIVDFTIVDANARAETQLELARDGVVGHLLGDVLPAYREMGVIAEYATAVARGQALEHERAAVHPALRGHWLQFQLVPLGDGAVLSARDVTERRRAVEELETREERYRTMARYFPNGMVALLDRELRFLVADGAGLATVGLSRDDLEGRHLVDGFAPSVVAALAPALEGALAGDEGATELAFRGRTYATLVAPVRDGAGAVTGALLIAQDVTERAAVERLKGELVATVSHELRTPLTSIRGALGLMDGGAAGALPEQAATLVRIARANAERLIRLVNDVLDLEKIDANKVEYRMQMLRPADVAALAAEGMQGAAVQAGVRLVLAMDTERPFRGDRDRVLQVLTNLLANAVKFAPPGTEVVLRATDAPGPAPLRLSRPVRLAVEGGGPGIPADKLDGLFQKFHQVDASDARARGGTGLGLAITRAIVEQHGGRVGVESEPDVRTAFWCELPAWEARDESLRSADLGRTVDALRHAIGW